MLKKIIACLLILTFALCAVSCGKNGEEGSDAPDGMKSVTVEGEPFSLYVPMSWLGNTLSGISGATYPYIQGTSVSARYTAYNKTLDDYVRNYESEFDGVKCEVSDDTLGGEPAKRIKRSYMSDGQYYDAVHICAKRGGLIVSLNFYFPSSEYGKLSADLDKIRTNFKFKDRDISVDDEVIIDEKTPAGFKLASNPEIEYRLFVPVNWKCSPSTGASDAYFPESERTNVVVTSYIPPNTGRVSVQEYFRDCNRQYSESLDGYKLISDLENPEVRVNPVENINMYLYTFTVNAGDSTVKIMQAVFAFNQSFYTITYTAKDEAKFEEHIDDFYKILDNFRFM